MSYPIQYFIHRPPWPLGIFRNLQMTCDWNNYIQVNIYGRSLKELKNKGITLKSVLKEIGCDKIWIMEGSVYSGEVDEEEEEITECPRFSTPMHSMSQFPFEEFSNLDSVEFHDEQTVQDRDLGKHSPLDTNGAMSVTLPIPVPAEKNCARRKSAPEMNGNAVVLKSTRQPLLRTTSDVKPLCNGIALLKTNTVDPQVLEEDVVNRQVEEEEDLEYFSKTPQFSTPMHSISQFSCFESDETLDLEHVILKQEVGMVQEEDDTLQIDDGYSDEPVQNHHPPIASVRPSRSILRRSSKSSHRAISKTVSFKTTKGLASRQNKLHVIRCNFTNCEKTINWKLKHGKLALIDHALSHTNEKSLECHECSYSCVTVRQMRYHYRMAHKDLKIEGYGMLNVFSIPIDKMDIRRTWTTCYHRQMHIVGNISTRAVRRKQAEIVGE